MVSRNEERAAKRHEGKAMNKVYLAPHDNSFGLHIEETGCTLLVPAEKGAIYCSIEVGDRYVQG